MTQSLGSYRCCCHCPFVICSTKVENFETFRRQLSPRQRDYDSNPNLWQSHRMRGLMGYKRSNLPHNYLGEGEMEINKSMSCFVMINKCKVKHHTVITIKWLVWNLPSYLIDDVLNEDYHPVKTLRTRQNGHHLADDIFKLNFFFLSNFK